MLCVCVCVCVCERERERVSKSLITRHHSNCTEWNMDHYNFLFVAIDQLHSHLYTGTCVEPGYEASVYL